MAASHTSSSSTHHQILQNKYGVFLSFGGEDTRNNFTDHLHTALIRNGFIAFKDDETLDRENEISSELSKAIEESNVSIVILSKNYASSPWCLDDLAKIVECGNKRKDRKVFAVFYGVDPADVRKQKGEDFERVFAKYKEEFKENHEKVLKWRAALTTDASLAGWHLHDRFFPLIYLLLFNYLFTLIIFCLFSGDVSPLAFYKHSHVTSLEISSSNFFQN
ncbi:hypothetical protein AB3S75_013163 [Citrus x aurantiifolia]